MRQASSEEEWIEADEVQVSLAGDRRSHALDTCRHSPTASREGWPRAANSPNGRDH